MTKSQMVKDILVAIASVRSRATNALKEENWKELEKLMGDLSALQLCLTLETQRLIDEMDKAA